MHLVCGEVDRHEAVRCEGDHRPAIGCRCWDHGERAVCGWEGAMGGGGHQGGEWVLVRSGQRDPGRH
jgi:hypothetical protein